MRSHRRRPRLPRRLSVPLTATIAVGVALAGMGTAFAGVHGRGHHNDSTRTTAVGERRTLPVTDGRGRKWRSPSITDSASASPYSSATASPSTTSPSTTSSGTVASSPVAAPSPTATSPGTASAATSPSPSVAGPTWNPVWADDFNTAPSSTDWGIYDSAGNDGQGLRRPSAFSASNGVLTVTGTPDGTTGGMSRHSQQRYGKWEARVKTSGCVCYHPVLILWGTPGSWPEAGEIDYLESAHRVKNSMTVHYGADNSQVDGSLAVDMTQWHTYTVEWTPNYLAGYVDGQRFFYSTDKTIQPPDKVEATIQLDWFPNDVSTDQRTGATMDVDWIKQYAYVSG